MRTTSLAAYEGQPHFEALEPRILLDAAITIKMAGAAATSWAPGYENHNCAASEWATQGGVVLGEGFWFWDVDRSKPTYSFFLPDPSLTAGSRELSSIQVAVYGQGASHDFTHLYIHNDDKWYLSADEDWNIYDYPGQPARDLLVSAGDGVGYRLDVTFDATGALDWYDLKEVKVTYQYAGLQTEWLRNFQEAYGGSLSLQGFKSDVVDDLWDGAAYAEKLFYLGCQSAVSFAQNLSDIDGSLYSSVKAAANALKDLQNLGNLIETSFDNYLFWLGYDGPSQSTVSTHLNAAAVELKELAQTWTTSITDGTITGPEAAQINGRIDDALADLATLQADLQSAASSMWWRYQTRVGDDPGSGSGDAMAEIMLQSLRPLMRYNYTPTSLTLQDSYLPRLIEALQAQRFDLGEPDAPVVSAKTSSGGSTIPANTWQQDDDPYFYWNVPASDYPIVGYSFALDAQPDTTVDTTNTYWQYGADALDNGTHIFYVKAKNNAGVWGPAGSFTIKVDDSGDPITSLAAKTSSGGSAIAENTWQTDDDPYFYWATGSGNAPIAGYSFALDGLPDEVVDSGSASYQYPSDAVDNGVHTFYVKAVDQAGNWGGARSFVIKVDDAPPTGGTIAVASGAAETASRFVSLDGLGATDPQSGVAQMHFSNDGATWSAWESYAPTRSGWDLLAYGGVDLPGMKTVHVEYKDALGNTGAGASDTIQYCDGPYILWHLPAGNAIGPADHVDVGFSGAILANTFRAGDVTIVGPAGPVTPLGVTDLGSNMFRIHFAPQVALGEYQVLVGPEIADPAGLIMDQNRNGLHGEEGDAYEASFALIAMPDRWADIDLDTGTGSGPAGVIRILNDVPADLSAWSISSAGDVNGDGFADILVAVRHASPPGGTEAGETYLIFGHGGPWSDIDLNTGTGTGPAGVVRILGDDEGDWSGSSVSSAGDVNGDGFADILVGAPHAAPPGSERVGETYLIFGHGGPWSDIDLNTGTGAGPAGVVRILGDDEGDVSGSSVCSAGDVNGDGFADILVGAPYASPLGGTKAGETYLIFGHGGPWSDIDLNTGTGAGPAGVVRILGDDECDWSGSSVCSAGDVNGDGLADILVGAPIAAHPGGERVGETYLIFGHGGLWSDIDLNTGTGMGPAGVVRILGDDEDGGQRSGCTVSSAGDVNGDGLADILVGSGFGRSCGDAYLILGPDDDAPLVRWTGGTDGRWENLANWSGPIAPGPGAGATFDASAAHQPMLDQDESIRGVDFLAAGWTIGGSGYMLTVGSDGVDSTGAGTNTVDPNVAMGADSAWTVSEENTLVLNGGLNGEGQTLTKDGAGALVLGGSENRVSTLVINGGTVRLASGAGPLVLNSLSFGDLLGGLGGGAPASSAAVPPASAVAAPAAVVREVAQTDMVSAVPDAEPVVTAAAVLAQAFGMPLDVLRASEASVLATPATLSAAPAIRAAHAEEEEPAGNVEAESVLVPLLGVATPVPGVPASRPADLGGGLADVLAELALEVPLGA